MEEIKKRIDIALKDVKYPALSLDKVDEEEKILYMIDHENFGACVKDAFRVLEAFPEYAAVVFYFNGENRTVVTRQMTQTYIENLFWGNGWNRFAYECSLANVRAQRSTYDRGDERMRYAIWESPEGIAAGEELDARIAEAKRMLKPVAALKRAMGPSKREYNGYLAQIAKIKKRAEGILEDARTEYHQAIYDLYKQAIGDRGPVERDFFSPMYPNFTDKESYFLARVSSECSFADIRKNPDNYSRVSAMLKYVMFETPEGIAAGEKLDIAEAKYLQILKEILPLEEAMEPSRKEYEGYLEKINAIEDQADEYAEAAERKYHETIDNFYHYLIELEKTKRLEEAQEILAKTKFNGNGE